MSEESKTNYGILAIVAIVAIVALAVIFLNKAPSEGITEQEIEEDLAELESLEEESLNLVGQAIDKCVFYSEKADNYQKLADKYCTETDPSYNRWLCRRYTYYAKKCRELVDEYCIKCIDSDGGKDYYVKGTAKLAEEHSDYCKNSNADVSEYSCSVGLIKKDNFLIVAVYGNDIELQYKGSDKCSDAAPVAKFKDVESGDVIEVSIDSDGKFRLNLAGKIFNFQILDCSQTDSDIKLIDTPFILGERFNCPKGCKDGACIKEVQECIELWSCSYWSDCDKGIQTRTCKDNSGCGTNENKPDTTKTCCSDSDGGVDYYVKGFTNVGSNVGADMCCENNQCHAEGSYPQLEEWYCDNGEMKYVIYDCPNGCQDGACVKYIQLPDLTITKLKVYKYSSDVVAIDYCIKNIGNLDAGQFYLKFSNLNNPSWNFGGSGYNDLPVGKEFCFSGRRSGVGENGGNGYIKGQNTIQIFIDSENQVKESNEKNNILTYTFDTSVMARCDDSDGGKNYYVRGTTSWGSSTIIDSCIDSRLDEGFCHDDGIGGSVLIDCPNGC